MFAVSDRFANSLAVGKSDLATLIWKCAFPAHNLYSGVLARPFRDFRRRQDHALEQRTAALEKQMLNAAIAGIGQQTHREDKIDHIHRKPLSCIVLDRDFVGLQGPPAGYRLRLVEKAVNQTC